MAMKFKPGDKVFSKQYGRGFCHQVDESNKAFMYDFHFQDGTLIWMSKSRAEKEVSFAK